MPSLVGQSVLHYAIDGKLGEGGMGVVYRAQDTKLDRVVALKFLPENLTPNDADKSRFLQEAKAASALNHPNVCTIFDINEADGQQFIVMEYVEGKTLRQLAPIPKVQTAIDYAVQIGEALQEAHSRGIVHRDIKADNVMVNAKGQIKVLDFGLAKLRGSIKLTKTHSTLGTLAYMAPEQIQGGDVDARSDIFSYGVLLFEMLTGHLPFRGEHEAATMYAILHEEPASVLKGCPEAPPEMERIIHRALEKDPADRYQSVADMLSELRRTRKITTGVVRPTTSVSVTEPPPPTAPIAGVPPGRGRSRAMLSAVLGAGVLAVALAVYLLAGRHQTIDSVAVLPFENVGGDPNTEYLSDGITESLINTLSKLSRLTVMSRTSVFHYKGKEVDPIKAGKELGVRAVLVGRVSQRGDNLQISTELVDVSNSSHIWGEQYSKKLADILAVQEDIAKEISQQLKVTLVGEDEKTLTKRFTENTEAYQLYLKGRFHWNKRTAEDLQKAVLYFNQAIERDPGYALAYAGLASAYILFPEYSSSPAKEYVPRTEAAAKKALELDATLAEPHAALGLLKQTYRWDWKGAEAEYRRAIELNPNYPTVYHWYSLCLRAQGKFDEALVEITRAQELDPLSLIIGVNLGEILTYLQRDEQAREQYRKALDLDPNFSLAHLDFGMLLVRQKKYDEAISEIQKVRQIVGANNPYGLGHLGFIYARAGRKEDALAALKQLNGFLKEGYSLSVQIAFVYAGLGDNDKTFEWLDRGYAEQNNYFRDLKTSFVWESIRSDPRYAALLKKVGLSK